MFGRMRRRWTRVVSPEGVSRVVLENLGKRPTCQLSFIDEFDDKTLALAKVFEGKLAQQIQGATQRLSKAHFDAFEGKNLGPGKPQWTNLLTSPEAP